MAGASDGQLHFKLWCRLFHSSVSRLFAPTAVHLGPDPRLADSAPPQDIDCELDCKKFAAPVQRDERRPRPAPPGPYVSHLAIDQRLHGRARVEEKGDG